MTATTTPAATGTTSTSWTIDGTHSSANFSVRHLMISNVRGEFGKIAGTATFDSANPGAASVEAAIDVMSINTREEARDAHLKNSDFFDAAKFPHITFKSTSFKKSGDGYELTGDLTLKDVTKPVTLKVEGPTSEQTDPWGNTRVGASATTKIKRSDFNMTWNTLMEAGGMVVGDKIKIEIDVELVKNK